MQADTEKELVMLKSDIRIIHEAHADLRQDLRGITERIDRLEDRFRKMEDDGK